MGGCRPRLPSTGLGSKGASNTTPPTVPSGEEAPKPANGTGSGCDVGCLLASLVAAPVAVVGAFVGINAFGEWATNKAFAVLGPHLMVGGLGFLFLAFGLWGVWRLMTGHSAPGTTSRQKVFATVVLMGFVVLG